jgi:hypothetical protein
MLVLLIEGDYIAYMKCAVEMGSVAMIYIPSFTRTGSGIQKLLVGDNHTDIQTHNKVKSYAEFSIFKEGK